MVWYQEPWMVPAAAGLFALLVILSGVLVWRSKKKQRELLAAIEAARLKEREQAEAMLAGGALDENGELNLEAAFEPKAMGGGPEAINKIREKALEIAAKDPSSTAVVLRAWLAEEEQLEEKAAE
jgi:flagellar biosynthesis/type III secretory pathway M-ring protein FliF/YscJ